MQFKSDRQRRRHHTTRKTLQRYKRQLNGEDTKSWYATYHPHYSDHDHYELAFFGQLPRPEGRSLERSRLG